MFPQWLRYLTIAMMTMTVSSVRALGSSPAEDRLLRLVPANAEIVAGIEDPHHGDQSGRLLIVTHNNNVDLKDWIGLIGVDDRQHVDRLIEVGMSSPRGDLSEHLLLARGSFSGSRILDEAERNGGTATGYKGVRIVTFKPFAREQKEMRDTRWLAILNDNTAVFGTPIMVMNALDRYVSSAGVDSHLLERLAELKSDVNCWSVLTMPGAALVSHLRAGVVDDAGASLLHGISNVTLGVHYGSGMYGSGERVDFVLGAENAAAAATLAKALGERSQLLPIADAPGTHFEGVSVEQNEVRGSVRVKDKEFDGWLAAVYGRLSVAGGSGGENVARVGDAR
jgi:hypothetical protein